MSSRPTGHHAEIDDIKRPRRLRVLLWVALVVLLLAAQTLLVVLAVHYREARTQDDVEAGCFGSVVAFVVEVGLVDDRGEFP